MRAEGITVREVDGELLVLDVGAGKVHRLNATASHIWRQCDGTVSAETIAERLAAAFDVDVETALADTKDAMKSLQESGLLEGWETVHDGKECQ